MIKMHSTDKCKVDCVYYICLSGFIPFSLNSLFFSFKQAAQSGQFGSRISGLLIKLTMIKGKHIPTGAFPFLQIRAPFCLHLLVSNHRCIHLWERNVRIMSRSVLARLNKSIAVKLTFLKLSQFSYCGS